MKRVVLEKGKWIPDEEHTFTILVMGNLASTIGRVGEL
jgi:hypothetical protein